MPARVLVDVGLDLGMDDALAAAGRALDPAVHQAALAGAEAGAEVGDPVVPGEAEQTGRVAQHRLQNAPPPAADVALVELQQLADQAGALAGLHAGDVAHPAAVLVAERQVVEQILDRADAELAEHRGAARADLADELHVLAQSRERRGQIAAGGVVLDRGRGGRRGLRRRGERGDQRAALGGERRGLSRRNALELLQAIAQGVEQRPAPLAQRIPQGPTPFGQLMAGHAGARRRRGRRAGEEVQRAADLGEEARERIV